ncbi:Gfo/Idh/MocA family oxidoreductase [Blautia producta]|uniref:Gfo/Idh/MocA family oxidoreductase n=1 Tax=Blautia producta TaxID=33035 RepID=UPI0031B62DDE
MIGVCLVGAGRAGMIHARNFASRIPGVKMTAVADTMEDSAKRAAEELDGIYYTTDYKQALQRPDVDAVIVVTPTKYHIDVVLEAARAGKHVLCEKPMAMNPEECRCMIEAAKEHHVKLQIGFMRRFDKNFRRAKEILDSGVIGDVVTVKSLTHGPSTPREWMYDIEKSNGPLAEVNSHDIDTLRWLTGSEVVSLHAMAGNYRCREALEKYPDFYDTVLMNVRMKNGTIGNIDGAQGVSYGYDSRVDIVGTKGNIQIGGLQSGTTMTYTKEAGLSGDVVRSWMDLFENAYLNEDISFINCIEKDTEPEVTGYDGMKAVEIVRAGNESIKTGSIVELESEKGE